MSKHDRAAAGAHRDTGRHAHPAEKVRPAKSRGKRVRLLAGLAAVAVAGGTVLAVSHPSGGDTAAAGVPHPQPLPKKTFNLDPANAVALADSKPLSTPQPGSVQHECKPSKSPLTGAARPEVDIPSLCIYAQMVPTTVASEGLLIPTDVTQVGLNTSGTPLTRKGEPVTDGTTIIAGHVDDLDQGPGAFYWLYEVKPGADITVTDFGRTANGKLDITHAGTVTHWKVYKTAVVEKDKLPSDLYAKDGQRRLVLITCGGPLLHYSWGNTYADNVLVYATPA